MVHQPPNGLMTAVNARDDKGVHDGISAYPNPFLHTTQFSRPHSGQRKREQPHLHRGESKTNEFDGNRAMGAIGEGLLHKLHVAGLAVVHPADAPVVKKERKERHLQFMPPCARTISEGMETSVEESTVAAGGIFGLASFNFGSSKHHTQKSNRQRLMRSASKTCDSFGSFRSTRSNTSGACRHAFREFCRSIVMSGKFDTFVAIVVVLNSITMALESEVRDWRNFFYHTDWIFNVVYSAEAFMRWVVCGQEYFRSWVNILDLLIVISGWLTAIGELFKDAGVMDAIGALKVLRALRALRFCRMIAFFEGIWIVFTSFTRCMKPLFWTCLFVFVIVFIFCMFAVELIGTSSLYDGVPAQENYKRTIISFVSLIQVMTLDEWRAITQPLMNKQWWAYLFFVFYICVSSLALMNLITAVIVENAILGIRNDERHNMIEETTKKEEEKEQILNLFHAFDGNSSRRGSRIVINHDKHVKPKDIFHITYNWTAMRKIFETLDIRTEGDMMHFLNMVDSGTGDITLTELLEWMLDLRHVTEDKDRAALLHVTPSKEHKCGIIERVLAQQHAPQTISALLKCVEVSLSDIGLAPQPENADAIRAFAVNRQTKTRAAQSESAGISAFQFTKEMFKLQELDQLRSPSSRADSQRSPSSRADSTSERSTINSQANSPSERSTIMSSQPRITVNGQEVLPEKFSDEEEPPELSRKEHRKILRALRGLRSGVLARNQTLKDQRDELARLQRAVESIQHERERVERGENWENEDEAKISRGRSQNRIKESFVVKDHMMEMMGIGRNHHRKSKFSLLSLS